MANHKFVEISKVSNICYIFNYIGNMNQRRRIVRSSRLLFF